MNVVIARIQLNAPIKRTVHNVLKSLVNKKLNIRDLSVLNAKSHKSPSKIFKRTPLLNKALSNVNLEIAAAAMAVVTVVRAKIVQRLIVHLLKMNN